MQLGPALVAAANRGPLLTGQAAVVRRRRGYAIHAYVGANGAGKSLLAAMDTLPTLAGIPWACDNPDHLHTRQGVTMGVRKVLSTMRFVTPDGYDHPLWEPLEHLRQIIAAEHVDLVLDEVGGAAASTSGADDLPTPVKASLQELRRRDVLTRWTAPSWARASKVLREVSQAVTLVQGFAPVAHAFGITFDGPHEYAAYESGDVVTKSCRREEEHQHDAGRQWGAKRLMFARTFDATTFDEWNTSKRESIRPEVRSLFWRPGSDAERAYNTHGHVLKLGQVTDSGRCMDCDGTRTRPKCSCHDDDAPRQTRRGRRTVLADLPDPEVGPPTEPAPVLLDDAAPVPA